MYAPNVLFFLLEIRSQSKNRQRHYKIPLFWKPVTLFRNIYPWICLKCKHLLNMCTPMFIAALFIRDHYFFKKYLFIHLFLWLHLLLVATCGIWFPDQPRIKPWPATLGTQNLSYWTTREFPQRSLLVFKDWILASESPGIQASCQLLPYFINTIYIYLVIDQLLCTHRNPDKHHHLGILHPI